MRESRTPRVVAAAFLGLLFGAYKHFQQVRELAVFSVVCVILAPQFGDKITWNEKHWD